MRQFSVLLFVVMFFSWGCREQYYPSLESLSDYYLVVEGNIDPLTGQTSIYITRTFRLDDSTKLTAETNALVSVEGKDNTLFNLVNAGNGYYTDSVHQLVTGNEYRVRIRVPSGKEYLSAYVRARETPPIDSVGWERDEKGVHIYVNATDPASITKYYYWKFDETWEIHSDFFATLIYENGMIRDRIYPNEYVDICWKHTSATGILLANTTHLQSDIISKAPVQLIPIRDDRLGVRYSILVKQYGLDKEAYNFLELMKQNTQNIGSFFGPLPSEIRGNLYSVNYPDEPVIGFVTASSVSQKRIFISAAEVPGWALLFPCPETIVPGNRDSVRAAVNSGLMIVTEYGLGDYQFSLPSCVDCTKRDGTTKRPSYW